MGFDMQKQAELNAWMATTIQYAMVSNGTEDIDDSVIRAKVMEVTRTLPAKVNHREIVGGILVKAQALLGSDDKVPNEELEDSYLTNIVQWAMMTVAAVYVAKGQAFHNEKIEHMVEEKIINPVMGNRSHPTRHELDLIVRKGIAWGLEQLELVAV